MTPIYYERLMFFSHFNAGVRAVDIRDPYHPNEVAYYVPAITENTDKRCIKLDNGEQRCKVAIRRTMSRSTTAVISISSTAPIPGCTSSN